MNTINTALSMADDPKLSAPARLEQELLDAALEGDGNAFAALMRPHLDMLYRVAFRVCSNTGIAEDAVQETLLVAYRKLNRYRPGTSLKAHLAAIAVRRAHTLLRAELRRTRHESDVDAPRSLENADRLLEFADNKRRVREVLAGLPKKRRAAAMLRLDAGLSYAEIALALKTSESSARVLVHLALETLRQRLKDLIDPADEDYQ